MHMYSAQSAWWVGGKARRNSTKTERSGRAGLGKVLLALDAPSEVVNRASISMS